MKVKIKFEADNGAELREQMLTFLGFIGTPNTESLAPASTTANNGAENLIPDATPKKRKTKAEIDAEKVASLTTDAPQGSQDQGGDKAPETTDTSAPETVKTEDTPAPSGDPEITRAFLTETVLAKGRAGKKPQVMQVFAGFMQADMTNVVTGLPNLQPEDYKDFYDKVKDL